MFSDDSRCLNLVHYATDDRGDIFEQLVRVMEFGGSNCHGIQLNVAWPYPRDLEKFRRRYPDKVLVLQCGRQAMAREGDVPRILAQTVQNDYNGLCDYVLIDPSGGAGKLLDVQDTERYLDALHEYGPKDMLYGIAGGLTSETLHLIESIVKKYPSISIDAEGGLRDADDNLDRGKVQKYFSRSYMLFRSM